MKLDKIVFSLFTISIITILIVGTVPSSVFAESLPIIENFDDSSDKFIPGQVVVGLKNTDPHFNAKVNARGGQIVDSIKNLDAFVIKVPAHTEEKFISSISKNPNIKYAERDTVVNALYTPNDPLFNIQWGMQRIGMESVWDVNPNLGAGIIVAVVDTGIYYDHPDFAGTIIRTDIGYDFVDDDTNTRPTAVCLIPGVGKSAESHSTFVSGIIAATKDNSLGVSGVAPVDILPIRVLGTCGSGSGSDVAAGIIYAADNGADVINLSLGSPVATQIELDAVNYAYTAGVVIVAAAGNDGNNLISYPAGYENVISVSATAQDDTLASYSQFGNTIELSAPGGTSGTCSTSGTPYIVSTGVVPKGNSVDLTYTCGTGTSFAAPHVSGVAALIKASIPGITNDGIRQHLQDNAEDLGAPGRDDLFGYGLVNAMSVLDSFEEPPPNIIPTADDQLVSTDEDTALPITLTGTDADLDALTFTVATPPTNGILSGTAPNLTYTPNADFNGSDLFTFKANDGTADSNIATISIIINPVDDAPTADAAGPYIGTVNEAITFDGTGSSDPDGDALTYTWNFGDGSLGTGESPSHTYFAIDEFTVKLTVSDGITSDISTTTVTVNDISAEVSVDSITPSSVTKGQSVNVTIYGSGFASGASVSLSNGKGTTPSVSNVVVNSNTITVDISTSSKGPKVSVWDVTVTNTDLSSGSLVDGFTVKK